MPAQGGHLRTNSSARAPSPIERARKVQRAIPLAALAASALLLAGCATPADQPPKLVLVTHDSFALSDGTLDTFTDATGIEVDVQAAGDAGELVNKLVLTKDSPLG